MNKVSSLFCKHLEGLAPYTPIEPPDQIAKRLGLPEKSITKLDANENPYGTAPEVLQAISQGKYYHIYPDPAQSQLRNTIANYADCKPENVVAGTGADELIDLLCRLVIEPNEKVLTFTPTFSYYKHVLTLNRAQLLSYPREPDFSISLEKAKQIPLGGVKLVFLCSPNNPTGNLLEEEVLEYFLHQNILVVVDEAYFEFSGQSFGDKINNHENLVVLRTFSKCFALAGLRVGYGLMSTTVAKALMKIKPPYSVNVAAEIALLNCLENIETYQQQMAQLIHTRESFKQQLQQLQQIEAFPSQSNFILCRIHDHSAKKLHKKLENQGFLVRYFETEALKNFFRISVGTPKQMKQLFSKLSEAFQKKP